MTHPIADPVLRAATDAARAEMDGFIHQTLAKCVWYSKKAGYGSVKYNDPALHNALLAGGGYEVAWNEAAPAPVDMGEGEVEIDLSLHQTAPISVPDDTTSEVQRMMDITDAANIAVDMAGQLVERRIIAAMTGAAFNAETFSGTGALDQYPSDANPAKDLRLALLAYQPLRRFRHLKLVARMDETYMNVLAGYTSFQQSGMAFDSDGKLWTTAQNRALFASVFAQQVGVDEVHISSGVYNSAIRGATPVLAELHTGVFWIGLEDRRQGTWDLTQANGRGPSGALAWATCMDDIYTKRWAVGGGSEEERVNGRVNLDIITPLYTAHGITAGSYWPESEILT